MPESGGCIRMCERPEGSMPESGGCTPMCERSESSAPKSGDAHRCTTPRSADARERLIIGSSTAAAGYVCHATMQGRSES